MVQGADKRELNQDEVGKKCAYLGRPENKGSSALITRRAHLNPGHKYDPILTYFPPS
jgi:hypothetical protein